MTALDPKWRAFIDCAITLLHKHYYGCVPTASRASQNTTPLTTYLGHDENTMMTWQDFTSPGGLTKYARLIASQTNNPSLFQGSWICSMQQQEKKD